MSFDYSNAEAWESSTDTLLPVGNHVATIRDPAGGESSGGYPQIELRVENVLGSLRDWIVITPATVGKVAQLYDAAGVERPKEGEFDPETGRLTTEVIERLDGREVGVVIREEPKYNDPLTMRRRVMGYVDKAQINADMPADTAGLAVGSSAGGDDDRVPF